MMIFMLIGAVDRIRGNRWGYGEQFEEGFHAIGPMMLAMAGVIAAAPVLAIVLKPIVVPIYQLIGADASMFAGTLLASDTGGYPLAMELAGNNAVGNFSGLLVANMLGATLVFTLPVGMSLMKEKDYPYLGAGVLAGIITIPIGCLVGGIVMNFTSYKMSLLSIIRNMLPCNFDGSADCNWSLGLARKNAERISKIWNMVEDINYNFYSNCSV